jgi:hypothetical protein
MWIEEVTIDDFVILAATTQLLHPESSLIFLRYDSSSLTGAAEVAWN